MLFYLLEGVNTFTCIYTLGGIVTYFMSLRITETENEPDTRGARFVAAVVAAIFWPAFLGITIGDIYTNSTKP